LCILCKVRAPALDATYYSVSSSAPRIARPCVSHAAPCAPRVARARRPPAPARLVCSRHHLARPLAGRLLRLPIPVVPRDSAPFARGGLFPSVAPPRAARARRPPAPARLICSRHHLCRPLAGRLLRLPIPVVPRGSAPFARGGPRRAALAPPRRLSSVAPGGRLRPPVSFARGTTCAGLWLGICCAGLYLWCLETRPRSPGLGFRV
jgi:hypothetical protein